MAVTLCPYALAAGCRRCPVFRICPLKGVIGDQREAPEAAAKAERKPTPKRK